MKRMYLPRNGSKRYNELMRICPRRAHWCIHCGRILLHPLSIMNHIGGVCQAKQAALQEQIADKKDISGEKFGN